MCLLISDSPCVHTLFRQLYTTSQGLCFTSYDNHGTFCQASQVRCHKVVLLVLPPVPRVSGKNQVSAAGLVC